MKITVFILVSLVSIVSCQPTFDRFDFINREVFLSGTVINALETGGPQPTLPSTLAISASLQQMQWNLEESYYFLDGQHTFIVITSLPGICFRVSGFNITSEGDNWSSLRHVYDVKAEGVSGNKHRRLYQGEMQSDMGSGCDVVSAVVMTNGDDIKEFASEQMFPGFGGPGVPTRNIMVLTRFEYTFSRRVRPSDFLPIPAYCYNTTLDFTDIFYRANGFCVDNTAVPLEFTGAKRNVRTITYNNIRYRGMTLNNVVIPVI